MAITFNGLATPQLDRSISVLNTITTTTSASTYTWELLDKPSGSLSSLSSTTTQITTLTPDRLGSYLVKVTLNNTTEEYGLMAVRSLRSNMRYPAAGEGSVDAGGNLAGSRSWATDVNSALRFVDSHTNSSVVVSAYNDTGGDLLPNTFVAVGHVSYGGAAGGFTTLYSGTSDEKVVPTMKYSNATSVYNTSPAAVSNVGYLTGLVGSPGTAVPNGGMGLVTLQGIQKTTFDFTGAGPWGALPVGTVFAVSNTPGEMLPVFTPAGASNVVAGLIDIPFLLARTLDATTTGSVLLYGAQDLVASTNSLISVSGGGAITPGMLINGSIVFASGAPITVSTPLHLEYDGEYHQGAQINFINLGAGTVGIQGGDANVMGGLVFTVLAAVGNPGSNQVWGQVIDPAGPSVSYSPLSQNH